MKREARRSDRKTEEKAGWWEQRLEGCTQDGGRSHEPGNAGGP